MQVVARAPNKTASHQLAEKVLAEQGYDLDKTVRRMRKDGQSWQEIAYWIKERTHRTTYATTVRRWYDHIT